MPTLRQQIQIDQQQAGEEKRLAWWALFDENAELFAELHRLITGFRNPWRLLAAIEERIHFWRDERHKDRYGRC